MRSHQNAAAAIRDGNFRDEIVPLDVTVTQVGASGGPESRNFRFDTDEGVRADTSLAALAGLKPVFAGGGSVTAGNSSQTSDGAAAVVVMDRERAESLGIQPMARF